MAHSANTFALSKDWNFIVQADGQLQLITGLQAIAQNVANEIKLFTRDAWSAFDEGNDWFNIQLGKSAQRVATSSALRRSALRVAGVDDVKSVEITEFDPSRRVLHAVVKIEALGQQYEIKI